MPKHQGHDKRILHAFHSEDDFEDATTPAYMWEEFRDGDGEFIGLTELKQFDLSSMPEDVRVLDLNHFSSASMSPLATAFSWG